MLIIHYCERKILIHLLGYHIDLLILLLFPQVQQQLACLLLICLTSGSKLLHLRQVAALHLLEYAQVPHVLARDSIQQGEIVGCVLVEVVIPNQYHLHLLHVVLLVHLESASVHYILEARLIGPSIEFLPG